MTLRFPSLSFFLPLLFLLVSLSGRAQVRFVAQAPQIVGGNEQVRLQFVLNNADGSDFTPPAITDFEVLAGPSTSTFSSTQIINGRTTSSSSVTYTFILAPKRKGTFRIGAASVKANGRVLRSQPLIIKVGSAPGATAQQGQPHNAAADPAAQMQRAGSRIGERDLFFTATISKRKVYEQEPIMLTYDFHARVGVGLANVMLRQKPDLKGFWTQEIALPRNLSPRLATLGGKTYRVGTNLQYLVFPQQTGRLTIPAVTFDCDILQQNDAIDEVDAFFNGMGSLNVKVQRTTTPLTVEVLPLPQPRPADFSGGVGRMALKEHLVSPTPKTNDIATVRLVVSGMGNLKLIKAPQLTMPKGFDTYPVKTTDHTRITAEGITGEMWFDYNFVPRNIGTYTLPAATLTYFDTTTERYVTLRTQPLTLHVAKGNRSAEAADSELALRNADIRDLHTEADVPFAEGGWSWIGSWRYMLVLSLFVLLGLALERVLPRWVARRNDTEGRRRHKASTRAHRRLQAAEREQRRDGAAFYDALSTALMGYFADKFSLDVSALTRQQIAEELRRRGVDAAEVEAIHHLLEDIDYGRFAPHTETAEHEHLFRRANDLIHRLDLQLR